MKYQMHHCFIKHAKLKKNPLTTLDGESRDNAQMRRAVVYLLLVRELVLNLNLSLNQCFVS